MINDSIAKAMNSEIAVVGQHSCVVEGVAVAIRYFATVL